MYDCNGNVREHIVRMTDEAFKFKSFGVQIFDYLLVHLLVNTLPDLGN